MRKEIKDIEDDKDKQRCPLCNSLGLIDTLEIPMVLDGSYDHLDLAETLTPCPACNARSLQ